MSVNASLDYRNDRQKESYNDVIDIYSGSIDTAAAADGMIKAAGKPTLLYSGVPAKLDETDYDTQPAFFGRTFQVSILTNDVLYVCADQPMADATFFILQTTGHPQKGMWWAIESSPQIYPSRGDREANYTRSRVKQCIDPTYVPTDAEVA